jgi:hypothetical protein
MKTLKGAACFAATLFFVTSSNTVIGATGCEINTCRLGGRVDQCWAGMKREAKNKSKFCRQIVIGSGHSAYAMALSLPDACIKANAVIGIHRPFNLRNAQASRLGSRWHNFYFGRINPYAVSYFAARGGMRRNGLTNANYMVAVPANRTGVPICKAQK